MVMRFKAIVKIIGTAGENRKLVRIYYPETERHKESWRTIEVYSLATDLPPKGEHLVYRQDHIRAGHILNAYTLGSNDNDCHSFILGKISRAQPLEESFDPRWEIKF